MRKNTKNARKRGQTSVEYILIIAAVVGVIMIFGKNFRGQIEGVTKSLFGGINKGITDMSGGGGG